MRVLGFDVETTGLDPQKDRIIEVGAVLWDVEQKVPLKTISDIVKQEGAVVSEEITKITGITPAMVDEFGVEPLNMVAVLNNAVAMGVDYIVAHNGENFDKPFLMNELDRLGIGPDVSLRKIPWIDTRSDIPFEKEPESRRLKHLALDLGFINPFPHRAVFDVLTMLKVLSHYDITKIVEYQKVPWITVRAVVSYDDRQKAKDLRYQWEKAGDKTFPKCWVKRIKQTLLDNEIAAGTKVGVQVVVLEEK